MTILGQQEQTVRICILYVVYIPAADAEQALAECLEYAGREHPEWGLAGVVTGDWAAVVAMLGGGQAEVVVIAQRSHLPVDRIPRVIAVEEQLSAPVPAARDSRRPAGRRPRLF
jgi:hypothetical protein